jgi:YVTN family beta-propeller protein
MLRNLLTVVLLLCAACAASASEVYVVNTLSQNISVIDTRTDAIVAMIPLNAQGNRVAFSPRGDKAYVTASPGVIVENMKAKVDYTTTLPKLVVVDTATRKVEASILLEMSALANVHVHPNGRTLFVVTAAETGKRNEERGRVIFLDLPNRRIVSEVAVGLNPLDSVMTPDGGKLFVANYFSRDISVVNLNEKRLQDNIPLGVSPVRAIAMRPDGKKIYVVQDRSSASNLYDVRSNDAMRRARSQVLAKGEMPPSESQNVLWEIDATTHHVAKFSFDGLSPIYALAISPDGKRLYAHGRSGSATVSAGQNLMLAQGGTAGMPGMGGFGGGNVGKSPPPAPSGSGSASAKGSPPAQQPERGGGGRGDASKSSPAMAQRAIPAQQAAPIAEATELIVFDLTTHHVVQRLANLPFSTMVFSPDGKKLYLVGTPGNEEAEAKANRLAYEQQVEKQTSQSVLRGGAAQSAAGASPADANELIKELRALRKTVTVLDAQTGKVLKTLTVGSLPQGAGALK